MISKLRACNARRKKSTKYTWIRTRERKRQREMRKREIERERGREREMRTGEKKRKREMARGYLRNQSFFYKWKVFCREFFMQKINWAFYSCYSSPSLSLSFPLSIYLSLCSLLFPLFSFPLFLSILFKFCPQNGNWWTAGADKEHYVYSPELFQMSEHYKNTSSPLCVLTLATL